MGAGKRQNISKPPSICNCLIFFANIAAESLERLYRQQPLTKAKIRKAAGGGFLNFTPVAEPFCSLTFDILYYTRLCF